MFYGKPPRDVILNLRSSGAQERDLTMRVYLFGRDRGQRMQPAMSLAIYRQRQAYVRLSLLAACKSEWHRLI